MASTSELEVMVKRYKADFASCSPPCDTVHAERYSNSATCALHTAVVVEEDKLHHQRSSLHRSESPSSEAAAGVSSGDSSPDKKSTDGIGMCDGGRTSVEELRVIAALPGQPHDDVRGTGGATATTSVAYPSFPVTTDGAITTLRCLGQLQMLVSCSTNPTASHERIHPSLLLRPGETVMLLLHFGKEALHTLISSDTAELSQMRVFTLDLATLPMQDYDPTPEKPTITCLGESERVRLDGAFTSHADTPLCPGTASDEDDEEDLMPSLNPVRVSASHAVEAAAIAGNEFPPRLSTTVSGVFGNDETASASSLSAHLHHVSDVIREKLQKLLAVDTILNPNASQQNVPTGALDDTRISAKEPLLFPAMIVWRAAGAPREEYPPDPPQTNSPQLSFTPAHPRCDRISSQGGPLVVKEATGVDQVHSLTLFSPVYTVEHLFRTVIRTLIRTNAPSSAATSAEGKSRTLIYLGASWCPPCMRIVREMPGLMRTDLPASVVCTVKADMDLAKPIYDFFDVKIIPTFVVLDNDVLVSCHEAIQRQQRSLGDHGGCTAPPDYTGIIRQALSASELGRLQNSNRILVSTFISKHCESLSFDEDF